MIYTTVSVSAQSLTTFQRDFLVKSGFAILGVVFTRSIKSDELHIVVNQLANKNIPFSIKSAPPAYNSKPCGGCKR